MAGARLMRAALLWLIGCAVMACAGVAAAHQAPNSEAYLDFAADRLELEVVIPAAEYAYASGHRVAPDAAARAAARAYLVETITVASEAGPWPAEVTTLAFRASEGGEDLLATLAFRPPSPERLGSFRLGWSAVIGAVPDHFVLVMLRRDPNSKLGEAPDVIGTLRGQRQVLAITRGTARGWMPFANAVRLGADHILGGLDHLAFLLALLLPLPLLAAGTRWGGPRAARPTLRAAAILISGFTLGHSATLIAASLGGLTLPGALVEVLIAVSVLIAALHAIRPLFPQREAIVATLFGLIHGLGFAGFLSATDLSVARNVITLLGFNLGIELVQIAIALAVVPALVSLAASPAYQALRAGLALFCGALAMVWMADRLGGLSESFVAPFESGVEAGLRLVFVGLLAAGALLFARRLAVPAPRTG